MIFVCQQAKEISNESKFIAIENIRMFHFSTLVSFLLLTAMLARWLFSLFSENRNSSNRINVRWNLLLQVGADEGSILFMKNFNGKMVLALTLIILHINDNLNSNHSNIAII